MALQELIGRILMTVLLVSNFRLECDRCRAGVEAPVVLFASFINAFGCFSVVLFFFVFHRAHR
jgi:hypothetical protein